MNINYHLDNFLKKLKRAAKKVCRINCIDGIFEARVYKFINGEKVLVNTIVDHNLVVDIGRGQMKELLSNDDTNGHIGKISFGTGTATPTVLDSSITAPYTKAIDGFSYLNLTSVKYNWTLGITENNGVTIEEVGLLCENGTLFARKLVPTPIEKENDTQVEGSWTILFS